MIKKQMIHKIDLTQGRHAEIQVGDHDDVEANDHKTDLTQGRHAEMQVGDHDDEEANDHKLILPWDGMLRSRLAIMMM